MRGCKVHDLSLSRSPFDKANCRGYKQLKGIIQEGQYDVIHTHTPIASALVRVACRRNKDIKVIYTAHGFHFYKGASWLNWLFYYPVEKWLSRYTDVLITINKEDYERAKRSFKAGRIEYVPGVGVDVEKYGSVVVDRKAKRKELGIMSTSKKVICTRNFRRSPGSRRRRKEKLLTTILSTDVASDGQSGNWVIRLERR
jgi:hypothetical protein